MLRTLLILAIENPLALLIIEILLLFHYVAESFVLLQGFCWELKRIIVVENGFQLDVLRGELPILGFDFFEPILVPEDVVDLLALILNLSVVVHQFLNDSGEPLVWAAAPVVLVLLQVLVLSLDPLQHILKRVQLPVQAVNLVLEHAVLRGHGVPLGDNVSHVARKSA